MVKNIPIKVCGITRLEDAQLAVDLGAFALGFIFYAKSPRYIAPEKVRKIITELRCERPVLTVGVFVNSSADELREYSEIAGIDILQLHGDESPVFVESLKNYRLWKAFRLKDEGLFELLPLYQNHVEAFLFDAAVEGHYGGTGQQLDGALVSKIPKNHPFILAGGLDASNAKYVFDRHLPMALDLSSGVESSPGFKDPHKLKNLFSAEGSRHGK